MILYIYINDILFLDNIYSIIWYIIILNNIYNNNYIIYIIIFI